MWVLRMDDLTQRRLDNLITRRRRHAEEEIETITALARGLNLALEPRLTLAQAERLATAAVRLVGCLAQLDGIEDASSLMGVS
jgi:hypothetical protein